MEQLVECARELVEAGGDPSTVASKSTADIGVYPRSVQRHGGGVFFLARPDGEKVLVVSGPAGGLSLEPPDVTETKTEGALSVQVCPCSNANALYLQTQIGHLRPTTNPGRSAFGAGDRLGLSTPGHVRALRSTTYFPLFAQQSIREMDRTARTPEDVMATAVWGLVEEGFTDPWGADADHLKTAADIERVAPYGYTMFTLDPSDHIANPDVLDDDALHRSYKGMPWDVLLSSPEQLVAEYDGTKRAFTGRHGTRSAELAFDESSVVKCAVKYSAGIAHCVQLIAVLKKKANDPVDIEVSFDETDWPTSLLEHLFIASEFRRLEMPVNSLALRFPGAFEKGIDYKGDLAEFERTFAVHAAIRDAFDAYRLSIHSGSDKLTVYPIMSKYARDHLHVKTAGTTYLEALRVAARRDPAFFGEILAFSYGRYEREKRTYHVSADVAQLPAPGDVPSDQYAALLDDDGWRQVLHVAFGAVLTSGPKHDFRRRLCDMLSANEEDFYGTLKRHFGKHLEALGASTPTTS